MKVEAASSRRALLRDLAVLAVAALLAAPGRVGAAGLVVSEHQVTAGADVIGPVVLAVNSGAPYVVFQSGGRVFLQWLDSTGAPSTAPLGVSPSNETCVLEDANGSRIIYWCYGSVGFSLLDVSTLTATPVALPQTYPPYWLPGEPDLFGDQVVFCNGHIDTHGVWICDLSTDPSCADASSVTTWGTVHMGRIDLGDRLIAWAILGERVIAYDLITDTEWDLAPEESWGVDLQPPATSGPWVVWSRRPCSYCSPQSEDPSHFVRAWNVDTAEVRELDTVFAEPHVSGDTVAWSCSSALCVHDLSSGASVVGSTTAAVERVTSVLGDLIAFTSAGDVYVVRISSVSAATAAAAVGDASAAIATLAVSDFRKRNNGRTLLNKLDTVSTKIDAGLYSDALTALRNDILRRTDGCAAAGAVDSNDWIVKCAAQGAVYPHISRAIDALQRLP